MTHRAEMPVAVVSPLEILSRTFIPIEVPEVAVSTCHTCAPPISGIYLLIDGDDIVYVGRSKNVPARLHQHAYFRRTFSLLFDRALYLQLPRAVLPSYEGTLFRFLRPRHNEGSPGGFGHDAEILYGLGLVDELSVEDVDWQEVA